MYYAVELMNAEGFVNRIEAECRQEIEAAASRNPPAAAEQPETVVAREQRFDVI